MAAAKAEGNNEMATAKAVCEGDNDEQIVEDGQAWIIRRVPVPRATSVRVLIRDLTDEEDFSVDSNFFDADYSLEASTGNQLWEGARELVREISRGEIAERFAAGAPVLELGAGTGLAGLSAASLGAHAVLTDVRAIASGVLQRNVRLNERVDAAAGVQASSWHPRATAVGDGSAACHTLDWYAPALEQLGDEARVPPGLIILAADCVWHVNLLSEFVRTTRELLAASVGAKAYIASWERAKPGSTVFVRTRSVRERFDEAGCTTRELSTDPQYSCIEVAIAPNPSASGPARLTA
jgi:predicted nicotinamide N-methyase